MKKIFCLIAIFASVSVFGQKWSVDSISVGRDRVATVYLTNENGQTMIKNIRAIVNPVYNQRGQLEGGNLDGRQGLMLTPPIKPSSWEKDASGNIVSVNFSHNAGSSANEALVYIVEGYYSEGGSIVYKGREETVIFNAFNPADWVRQYKVNSYEIPNFCIPVSVTKDFNKGTYYGR